MQPEEAPHPGSVRPGQVVAEKYWIERVLGRGGMGTIALATHLQLGNQVALKFLRPSLARDEANYRRFLREARATAQLRGEHVIRVLDMGITEHGVPFIVMEYLAGHDLDVVVARGALDIALAVDYVLQAAIGVAEAHAAGIVHRDLKPSNIFLTRRMNGQPMIKVMDFGLAKWICDTRGDLTASHVILGSPGYMAPEQLRNARTVDTRADIWSLGAVLYELLSGRRPYDGANVAQLVAQVLTEPPRPLPSTVPEPLRQIVDRCLSHNPDERFATVEALALALVPFGSSAAPELVAQLRHVAASARANGALPLVAAPTLDVLAPESELAPAPTNRLTRLVVALAVMAALLLIALIVKRSLPDHGGSRDAPVLDASTSRLPTVSAPITEVISLPVEPAATAPMKPQVDEPRALDTRKPARPRNRGNRTKPSVAPAPHDPPPTTMPPPLPPVSLDVDGDGIPDRR